MKTIKQIADELGVPKNDVKYRVRTYLEPKYPAFVHRQKKGNLEIILISDEGVMVLSNVLGVNQPVKPLLDGEFNQVKPVKNDENILTVNIEIVNLMRENQRLLLKQLEEKDRQLAEKDKQIKELTETVKTQAQSINADRHNELAGTIQKHITDEQDKQRQPNVFKRIAAAIRG